MALTATAVFCAVTFLVMLLRRNGFWIDELYTLHSIRLGWKEMVFERLHRGHFPGYFVLVRLWYGLWPERLFEVALRSFSVIFYLLALVSFWPLTRRALPQPASLVAMALFACNGIALRQASEARMYTVVLFLAVWITRAWFELQRPDASRGWKIAMPLLTVFAFAVSPTLAVLVGSLLVISFIFNRTNRRALWATAISLACGLAVFIPGALMHIQTARRLGISSSKPLVFLAHPGALMPGVQIWDDYYNSTTLLMVLLTLGLPITFLAGLTIWRKRDELTRPLKLMALAVALPYCAIVLCYPLIEIFELDLMGPARYFITLLPFAAMLGGWAVMSWPKRLLVHALLTLFLLLNAWAILNVSTEKFRQRLEQDLAPHYQPGDGLIVTAHEISDGVELYVQGAEVDEAVSRWIMDREEIKRRLRPLGDRQTVWLVWYRGNDSPLIEVAEEMWGPFQSNRPEKPHGSLRIYKFQPAAGR